MKFFYRIRTNETKSEELPEVPLRRSPSVTRKSLTTADTVPVGDTISPADIKVEPNDQTTMTNTDVSSIIPIEKPVEDQYEFKEDKKEATVGGISGLKIKYSSLKSGDSNGHSKKSLSVDVSQSKPKKTTSPPIASPDSDKKCEKIKLKIENNSVSIVKNYSSSTPSTSSPAAASQMSPTSQKSQSKQSKIANKLEKLAKSVKSKNKKLMKLENTPRRIDEIFKKLNDKKSNKSLEKSERAAAVGSKSPTPAPSASVAVASEKTPTSSKPPLKSILKKTNTGELTVSPTSSSPAQEMTSPKKDTTEKRVELVIPSVEAKTEDKVEEVKVLDENTLKSEFLNAFDLAPKKVIDEQNRLMKLDAAKKTLENLKDVQLLKIFQPTSMPPPATTNVPLSSTKSQIRMNILKRKNDSISRSLLKKQKPTDEEYKKKIEKLVSHQRSQSFAGTSKDPEKSISFNLAPFPIGSHKSPPKANAGAKASPKTPATDDSKIFKKPSPPTASAAAAAKNNLPRPTPHPMMNFKRPAPSPKLLAASKKSCPKKLPFILPKVEDEKPNFVVPFVPPKNRKNAKKREAELLKKVNQRILVNKTFNDLAQPVDSKDLFKNPIPVATSSTTSAPKAPAAATGVASGASASGKHSPKSMSNYLNYALMNTNKSLNNASTPFGTRTPIYSPNSPQYTPNYNLSTTPTYKYANPLIYENHLSKNGHHSPPLMAADAGSRKRPCISPPLIGAGGITAAGKDDQPPSKQQKTAQSLLDRIHFPASLSITLTNEQDDATQNLFSNPKRTSPPVNNYIEIVKLPDSPTKDDKSATTMTVSAVNLLNKLSPPIASSSAKGTTQQSAKSKVNRPSGVSAEKKDLLTKVEELNKKLVEGKANKCNEAPGKVSKVNGNVKKSAASSSSSEKSPPVLPVGVSLTQSETFQNKFLESLIIKQQLDLLRAKASGRKTIAAVPTMPSPPPLISCSEAKGTAAPMKKASSMPSLKAFDKDKKLAEIIRKSKSISPPITGHTSSTAPKPSKAAERKKMASPAAMNGGEKSKKMKEKSKVEMPQLQIPLPPSVPLAGVPNPYNQAQMATMMMETYPTMGYPGLNYPNMNVNLFQQLWMDQITRMQNVDSQKFLQILKSNNKTSTNDG